MRKVDITTFCLEEEKELFEFYNKNASLAGYAEYPSYEKFHETWILNKEFDFQGVFLAKEQGVIRGVAGTLVQKMLLPGETAETSPGYLYLILVDKDYQNQGIGTELLNYVLQYQKEKHKKYLRFSHKCPIKFTWNLKENCMQHNKAPGVKADSKGYEFLLKHGFQPISMEVSYYLDLKKFEFSQEMKKLEKDLAEKGYTIGYFQREMHQGQEEMFTRLKDESYRKKFHDALEKNKNIFVALKDNKTICGIAGALEVEPNGRGFFQGLAVDPNHGGKKLGNLLFFCLCRELRQKGADYMTLFVSEDNFARKIYEKAGFTKSQLWGILEKEL